MTYILKSREVLERVSLDLTVNFVMTHPDPTDLTFIR